MKIRAMVDLAKSNVFNSKEELVEKENDCLGGEKFAAAGAMPRKRGHLPQSFYVKKTKLRIIRDIGSC